MLVEVLCGGLARQVSRACGWGCGQDLFCRPYLEHLVAGDGPPWTRRTLMYPLRSVHTWGVKFIHTVHSAFSPWAALSVLVISDLAAADAHTRRRCRGWGRRDHGISRHCKTETEPVAVMLIAWAWFLVGCFTRHNTSRGVPCWPSFQVPRLCGIGLGRRPEFEMLISIGQPGCCTVNQQRVSLFSLVIARCASRAYDDPKCANPSRYPHQGVSKVDYPRGFEVDQ